MAGTASKKKTAASKSLGKKYSINIPSALILKNRTRNFKSTYVPVPITERLRRCRERRTRAAAIRQSITEICQYIRDQCHALATTWKMKPKYFLDMVYQGGVRLTKPANKLNPFNAFKAVIAHERREASEAPMTILDIQKQYHPQYDALDKDGLTNMLTKYESIKDEAKRERVKRPSIKEKSADVAGSLSHVAAVAPATSAHNFSLILSDLWNFRRDII
ncbi:hypothetical protein PQX77_021166 [Marasmius sp. AFHP31]|nr:hypothetical protein PQX77_021166 [Marasmius sp. AFHP31]